MTVEQAFQIALQHHQAGQLPQAENLYRQILAQQPKHLQALLNLGVLAGQTGRNDIAVNLIRQATVLDPDNAVVCNNLGIALRNNGQLDEAVAAHRHAIAQRPDFAESHNALGVTLANGGQLDEAIAAYRQAITLNPDYAQAHNNLGAALKDKGQLDEAIAASRTAIGLNLNYAEAHNNLGNALRDKGLLDQAITAYRKAIALDPRLPQAHCNLGNALRDQGQLDQAIKAYRQAVALRPNYAPFHGNLIYLLQFHPAYDAKTIAQQHRQWNEQHAQPLKKFIQPHLNDRSPDRRLKIGYLSPDFCDHCQSLYMLQLLRSHDRSAFEIFCYADVLAPDAMTLKEQSYPSTWRNIVGKNDDQVAQLIRNDRIDILVDLTMHMSRGRPLVLARKPAPVQVAWLAYPGTTGMTTIDFRLSDPYLDPPGTSDADYTEQTLRLPETFWCYGPHETDIEVAPLPADSTGHVTFGCLNNFCKINEQVLSLWANVLNAVPSSRLILLAPPGDSRQTVSKLFDKLGVTPQRIEFVDHQPRRLYLQIYHRIDIGLDTFPYNGHTTSLDSFWMGVPVITKVGSTVVGRAGWSQLSNLHLTELAAQDDHQFMSIATKLAGNRPRLSSLRSSLRPRMAASALMDASRFARNIEAAYRRMWHIWLKSESQP